MHDAILLVTLAVVYTFAIMNTIFDEWEIYSDNIIYKLAYNKISNEPLVDAYLSFKALTGGAEPVTFLVFWLFSNVFAYSTFIFISNITLVFTFSKLIKNLTRSWVRTLIVLLPNYYLIVVMIGIQRFKYALILILLALIFNRYRIVFWSVSCGAHFQSLIAAPAFLLAKMNISLLRLFKVAVAAAVALALLHYLSPEVLQHKLINKINWHFDDLAKALVISIVALVFTANPTAGVLVAYLLLCGAAFVVGGYRINILIYFLSLFTVLVSYKNKKRALTFIILSSTYLLFKSVELYYGHYTENLFIDGDIRSIRY